MATDNPTERAALRVLLATAADMVDELYGERARELAEGGVDGPTYPEALRRHERLQTLRRRLATYRQASGEGSAGRRQG